MYTARLARKFEEVVPREQHQFGEVIYTEVVCDTCGYAEWRRAEKPNPFAARLSEKEPETPLEISGPV
jgi:hypothetical protein